MKQFCCALAAALLLVACGNDATTADGAADSTGATIRGVENVNGNIPDTAATGAEPNTKMHTDSVQ